MLRARYERMVVLPREHPECLRALMEVIARRELSAKLALTDSVVRVVDPAEVQLDATASRGATPDR